MIGDPDRAAVCSGATVAAENEANEVSPDAKHTKRNVEQSWVPCLSQRSLSFLTGPAVTLGFFYCMRLIMDQVCVVIAYPVCHIVAIWHL